MTSPLAGRLRFPSDRSAFIYQGAYQPILTPPATWIVIYTDEAGTQKADITDTSGDTIPQSQIQTTPDGLIPEFYGPVGAARVYALVSGATSTKPLDAQAIQAVALPTISTGTGAPTSTNVAPGSFYIDKAASALYGPYDPTTGWGSPTALATGGGSGTVTSVNSVSPVSGNVTLTASSVGADPAGAASTAQTNAETFATNAVTPVVTAVNTETTRAEAAEAALYTKPSGGIPITDLATGAQTDLSLAASAYQKPGTGIPSTDLSTGVQASLGLANTALQSAPVTSFNGRTGAITPTTGDYIAAQVGADAAGAASAAQSAAQTFATNAVATETTRAEAAEALLAPKASPAFTGIPVVPTAAALTNTTQIASTAYTDAAVGVETTRAQAVEATKATSSALTTEISRAEAAEALLAPLASPSLTGTPTAPTKTALTNSTALATTAYTDLAVGVEATRATGAESTLTSSVAAKYTKPGTGIPSTDLAMAVQTDLTLAASAYQKPVGGIPSTDMTSAVQTSLGLANTALQPGQGGTGTVTSVTAADATITIGGTASAPTVKVGTVQNANLAAGIQASLGLANTALQSAPVTTVFSRSGAVVATSGDYSVGQVTGAAPLASPTFTGTPAVPTATPLTNTTQVASTAYADGAVAVEKSRAQSAESLLAPLASPALTGTPTLPTATALTNSTQAASTAYTDAAVAVEKTRAQGAEALLAPLASPALTGTPTAPTKAALTNSTALATTAYTDAAVGVETTRATTAEGLLASKASPALTGTPTAPTATALTNNTQLATTAYTDSAVSVESTRALAAEAVRKIVAPPPVLSRGRATVITTYASGHGWTAASFASSNVNDTSDGRLSGQMLSGTTTGNASNFPTFTKTGAPSISLTGNCLRAWIKVDVPTNVSAITLRVAGTGGLSGNNYLSWTALSAGSGYRTNGLLIPPNTWTELSFSLGSAFTTGTPTPAAITEYRWICQDNGTAFTVHFGGIEMYSAMSERYPNGVVALGFDDCYSGQFSLAMNLLSSYGYVATIFPIIDQIGQAGSFTLAQLQQMVSIGWEVAPHAYTLSDHSGWNSLTAAQQAADVIASQTWIAGQGFGLSGAYAYPLGGFNNGADGAVAPLVKIARTIDSTLYTESLPLGNPLHMRSAAGVGGSGGIGVTTYTTASTGVLALAKTAGAIVPITIHDVSSGTSGNINQISIADLTTLIAAINTAGMAMATYGELVQNALSNVSVTPLAATDSSIVLSGSIYNPTIGVGVIPESKVTNLVTDLAAKAPLASPALTGVPTSTTATALTNNTQIATTAYADSAVAVETVRAKAAESSRVPSENYLLGWTAPPESMSYNIPLTAGEVYLQRIVIPVAGSITKIYSFVITAGSGLTSTKNLLGLYDANGNLLATSGDMTTAWGSTHVAIGTVSSVAVTAGQIIYAAALANGTTPPQLAGGGAQYWDLPNVGAGVSNWASASPPYTLAPNHWRYMSYSSGLVSLPASVTLSNANPDKALWLGVA